MSDQSLLPKDEQERINQNDSWTFFGSGAARRARVIADYIAGMTDRYAIAEHERLFAPEDSD